MKFRRSQAEPVSLNLTPLIDVVFLLLIFFMVSTTFERTSELQIQLPDAQNGVASEAKNILQIEITEQGQIYLNSVQISTDLPNALQRYLTEHNKPEAVSVIADGRALHLDVSKVLDALAGTELNNISFQTRVKN
ncbi:biopolymer transport protein ExbD [Oceanospirillum multiglobuliferum]|uniref:Biopolymer transporter ExbD n=1 Tax=Oceanospirillum multiglobuliferum TaxID=64969 RepID=A0A1T4N8N2_9GAMM|nr:biopolymer transporter ExbD [Oceanospirillum multiglobuliferum]OPX55865.1 hypothetical protein BTE48_06635 [Oceanospirillum multiglobuliferum]SJZ75208.1 biopolymer transport protein ExbD [Oceanospirillum multiglobuliferum]